MKRKLLSIIITVIVLLEAVSVTSSLAFAASSWSWQKDGKFNVASYSAPIVNAGSITVDANRDDSYLKGTKITNYPDAEPFRRNEYKAIWDSVRGNFEAYVALDINGMYVYAEIEDITIHDTTNTDGNDGDFFQIYLDWTPANLVHPSAEELYSRYSSGKSFDYQTYKTSNGANKSQHVGWISVDYYGVLRTEGGFRPYDQLGPNGTDSILCETKIVDGGWICEWFIPWRDDEQKSMIDTGKQFHIGVGFQASDDTDVNDLYSGEKDVGICYDQRNEIGLQYWADYTRLSDITPILCTHKWQDGGIVKEPTCTEAGTKLQTCTLCDYNRMMTVNSLEHTKGYVTCTVAKKRDMICTMCGITISQGLVASTTTPESHVFVESEDNKVPTCTETGSFTIECKYCQKTASTDEIPATGHSYSYHEKSEKYRCVTCGVKAPVGDTDNDGNVTNSDVLEIYRYIYNSELYPLSVTDIADVDDDGDVTNADVLCIFRYIYNPELYPLETKGEALLIDGTDARGYTIVYPGAAVNGEKELAEKLAMHLLDTYGAEIKVSDSWDGKGSAIVIGEHGDVITESFKTKVKKYTNYKVDMNHATLASADNILWIAATNSYTTAAAVDKLIELTTPQKHGESVSVSFAGSGAVNVTETDLGDELKIMSYNVQTGNQTASRVQSLVNNINNFDPDVIGTQELNHSWIQNFKNHGIFNEYTLVGEPRNGNKDTDTSNGNEYSAILFKTDKFNLIDSGTYWLSDTPTVVASRHSSSEYIRIMTYVVLERKSDGKRFVHVNTHLSWDSGGYSTNLIQINIILNLLETKIYSKYGELSTFFTGDYNVGETSAGYARMISWGCEDSRYAAKSTTSDPTFSGGSTIDFCFVSKGDFIVSEFLVGYGSTSSDHYPVYIKTHLN